MGQNQWYHFGVGAPPILVYFSGDWDVHWGYGILTHGQIRVLQATGTEHDRVLLHTHDVPEEARPALLWSTGIPNDVPVFRSARGS